VGLRGGDEAAAGQPLLPFALEEVLIVSACPARGFAWGRREDEGSEKLDIDVCDEAGRVCVRLRGFSTRSATGELAGTEAEAEAEAGNCLVTLTPVWEAVAVELDASWPLPTDGVVIVGGTPARRAALRQHYPDGHQLQIAAEATAETIGEQLRALGPIDHVVWLAPEQRLESISDDKIIEDQQRGVVQCFRLIKAMLGLGYGGKVLGLTAITTQSQAIHRDEAIDPTHASVHGLIGSLAKEHPNWRVRLVDLPSGEDCPLDGVLQLPADAQGKCWGYRSGEWYRRVLLPSDLPGAKGALHRRGGVYVVIGGAGGIGAAWSESMIRHYQARIIWIGRRPHDASIQAEQDRLAKLGPAPLYIEADATDRRALERGYARIKQEHAQVHGVVHSALVLRDRSLARMEEADFRAVLSAKVDVSVRLAQLFREDQLDFVLFFSSAMSFEMPAGQGNYAAGCSFKDAFAHALARAWSCPVKVMNWGYWGNIGIAATAEYRARMARSGLGSIETDEGMAALDVLLGAPQDQLAFVKTVGAPRLLKDFVVPDEVLRVYRSGPPSIAAELQAHATEPAGSELFEGRASLQEMEVLAGRLLWTQLIAAGFPLSERNDVAAIRAGLGLRASYDRWLDESLSILTAHGHLRQDDEWYVAVGGTAPAAEAGWREWEMRKVEWLTDPAIAAQVRLVETTLRALAGILGGAVRATDVMFPNGSLSLVEGIY
jgi:NAD(P)-dependent dehydrogenase (short-subunit alcohol dehydrogenase family)